ncbi:MAG: phosphoglyceromutase, partial [Bryobacterales bacterium]|nr:phosphoglyceromutase [Bryobacterales bacterium]
MSTRRLAFLFCLLLPLIAAGQQKTRNIILVTADGLRWQELFGGMDPLLENEKSAGMEEADEPRARLSAATREERRRKLMPFFWSTLAPAG